MICPTSKVEYFFERDWTGIGDLPVGQPQGWVERLARRSSASEGSSDTYRVIVGWVVLMPEGGAKEDQYK
jgi:hypothetical protein